MRFFSVKKNIFAQKKVEKHWPEQDRSLALVIRLEIILGIQVFFQLLSNSFSLINLLCCHGSANQFSPN